MLYGVCSVSVHLCVGEGVLRVSNVFVCLICGELCDVVWLVVVLCVLLVCAGVRDARWVRCLWLIVCWCMGCRLFVCVCGVVCVCVCDVYCVTPCGLCVLCGVTFCVRWCVYDARVCLCVCVWLC